jgi:hypothetical protein
MHSVSKTSTKGLAPLLGSYGSAPWLTATIGRWTLCVTATEARRRHSDKEGTEDGLYASATGTRRDTAGYAMRLGQICPPPLQGVQ